METETLIDLNKLSSQDNSGKVFVAPSMNIIFIPKNSDHKVLGRIGEFNGNLVWHKGTIQDKHIMKHCNTPSGVIKHSVGLNAQFLDLLSENDLIAFEYKANTYVLRVKQIKEYAIEYQIKNLERQYFVALNLWQVK